MVITFKIVLMRSCNRHDGSTKIITTRPCANMSFKLFELMLKIGTLLAITPTSPSVNESETIRRKLYALLVVATLAAGVVFSSTALNFYRDSFGLLRLILYQNDLILSVLSFYVITSYTFWKRRQWTEFVRRLEASAKMVQMDKTGESTILHYVFLVLSHAVFFAVITYKMYSWYQIHGYGVVKWYNVRVVEEYICFFYVILLATLVNTFREMYKRLNRNLALWLAREGELGAVVRKTGFVCCFLKETVNVFNDLFGWPIFFLVGHVTHQILLYAFFAIWNKTNSLEVSSNALAVLVMLVSFTLKARILCTYRGIPKV
jgi:gustatory receptor